MRCPKCGSVIDGEVCPECGLRRDSEQWIGEVNRRLEDAAIRDADEDEEIDG